MRNKIAFLLLVCVLSVRAQVRLQPLFTDNMVLQQQASVPVWCETKPGKTVKVTPSWNRKTYVTKADKQGKWQVTIETPVAGGPYDIHITDGKPIDLKNVLIGEVWLCSGQSNMEMPIEGWGKVMNYKDEEQEAQQHPKLLPPSPPNTSPQWPADGRYVVRTALKNFRLRLISSAENSRNTAMYPSDLYRVAGAERLSKHGQAAKRLPHTPTIRSEWPTFSLIPPRLRQQRPLRVMNLRRSSTP